MTFKYKYLGVLEIKEVIGEEMKKSFMQEHFRRHMRVL